MNRPRSALFPFAFLLLPAVGGCSSCEKDQPFVPYHVDPSASGQGASSAPLGSIAPAPPPPVNQRFTPVLAVRMKQGSKKARTAAGPIEAPAGGSFDLLLEADVTADGKPDVLAWMRSSDRSAGELVQFVAAREGGPLRPRTLVPLPADLTLRSGCKATTGLRQVGPRTVAINFRRTCTEHDRSLSTEWEAVVVPVRDPALRLDFLIDQPLAGEHLEIDLDALDRDGDHFDDLFATIHLSPPSPTFGETSTEGPSVALHYFDRPAGLSRDPHEPSVSFSAVAKRLEREAKGSKRDGVWPAARRARRLHHMLCAEAGHPRVRVGGAPLQCGASKALHRIARAQLDASIGGGDVLGAVGAYDRLLAGGASAKDTAAARKRIEEVAPRLEAESYHLPFSPPLPENDVAWGPLAFANDGALLIRTDTSVMRFDAQTRVALPDPASGPIAPWATRVEANGGSTQLRGVIDPCDGGLLQARILRAGAAQMLPLPIDAQATRGCSGNEPRPVIARPLAWLESGLALIVSDTTLRLATDGSKVERTAPTGSPGTMGGPASPDGKSLAHATSLGVLVMTDDGKANLWRTSAMAGGYDTLRACTVGNGHAAVACIDGSRTRVFLRKGAP